MRSASPELAAALDRGERVYDAQVRLGGVDVTPEVASWSLDRGSDTSLPGQVATPSGSTSARAQVTLAGQGGQTAASRYSPWAPRATADITRPGQSATLEWGLTQGRMQALRGRVTQVRAHSDGTAHVSALDGAELLRGRAWLPPALIGGQGSYIHAQWVVDHALRMAGIYASPPPRPGAIFYASMNASREANLGMRIASTGTVRYEPGRSPWTAAPCGATSTYSTWTSTYAPQTRVLSQSRTLLVEWWIRRRTTSDNPTSQVRLVFADRPASGDTGTRQETTITCSYDPSTRQLRAQVDGGSQAWTVPVGANQTGNFKVAFAIGLTTTSAPVTVRGWLYTPDGTLYATGSTYNGASPVWGMLDTVQVSATGPMECVGVTPMTGSYSIVEPWHRGATIDLIDIGYHNEGSGRYGVVAVPEPPATWWDLLKDVVSAHMGYMWFDEDGHFRVRRYDYVSLGSTPTPDLQVTAARDISSLSAGEDLSSVANIIEHGLTTYYSSRSLGERYDYTSVLTLAPGATTSLRMDFRTRPWGLYAPMVYAGTTIPTGNVGSLAKWVTSTGARAPVEMGLTWDSGWPVATFYNRGGSTAYSATTSTLTESSIRLAHAEVETTTHQPIGRQNLDSISRFGPQALTIPASPWVQNAFWADQIALTVIGWTAWPVPLSDRVEILPDPRIQIGDVVRVVDPGGLHIDGLYRVLGYTITGSGPSVRMTLEVRPLSLPDPPQDAGLTPDPVLDPTLHPPLSG